MPKMHPLLKLSREEEAFLRHWIFDEAHYRDGPGAAKRLQLAHGALPADLAILIAAALPDPAEQEAASQGPVPAAAPTWPWSEQAYQARLAEARALLAHRQRAP